MNDEDDKFFALVLAAVAGSAGMSVPPNLVAQHAVEIATETLDVLKAREVAA